MAVQTIKKGALRDVRRETRGGVVVVVVAWDAGRDASGYARSWTNRGTGRGERATDGRTYIA